MIGTNVENERVVDSPAIRDHLDRVGYKEIFADINIEYGGMFAKQVDSATRTYEVLEIVEAPWDAALVETGTLSLSSVSADTLSGAMACCDTKGHIDAVVRDAANGNMDAQSMLDAIELGLVYDVWTYGSCPDRTREVPKDYPTLLEAVKDMAT